MKHFIDKKLINILILFIIILLGPIEILRKLYHFFSYPLCVLYLTFLHEIIIQYLFRFNINRDKSILCVVFIEILIIVSFLLFITPLFKIYLYPFLDTLYTSLEQFLKIISKRYHLNISIHQFIDYSSIFKSMMFFFKSIITSLNSIVIIYLVSLYLSYKGPRLFNLLKDKEKAFIHHYYDDFKDYIKSYLFLMMIQGIMYGLLFYLFNHPYWFVLALLSSFSSIIPYIGSTLVNIVSILTFYRSPYLGWLILMECLLSNIDNYFISPKIYSHHVSFSGITILLLTLLFHTLFGSIAILFVIPFLILIKNLNWIKKKASNDAFH